MLETMTFSPRFSDFLEIHDLRNGTPTRIAALLSIVKGGGISGPAMCDAMSAD